MQHIHEGCEQLLRVLLVKTREHGIMTTDSLLKIGNTDKVKERQIKQEVLTLRIPFDMSSWVLKWWNCVVLWLTFSTSCNCPHLGFDWYKENANISSYLEVSRCYRLILSWPQRFDDSSKLLSDMSLATFTILPINVGLVHVREEVHDQRGGVGQTLQRRVHVAGVSLIAQSCQTSTLKQGEKGKERNWLRAIMCSVHK